MRYVSPIRAVCFVFCGLILLVPSFAQNPHGTLLGAVQDSSGARVAGASITATNAEISLAHQVKSDARGEFRLEELPPGEYRVAVNAPGFLEATSQVVVAVSSAREISVTLRPKGIAEKILVSAGSQSIATEPPGTASAVHQAVAYRQDLENIPLAARSFANIAYLAPGTEPVEPSDPTKARISAGLDGRKFRAEQRNLRGRRGQFRRLYRQVFCRIFRRTRSRNLLFAPRRRTLTRAALRRDPWSSRRGVGAIPGMATWRFTSVPRP